MDEKPSTSAGQQREPSRWESARAWAGHRWVWLRPRARQALLNLKIWAPVMQNPRDRERMVTYSPRENREGNVWKVALPKRCWFCGTTENLWQREYTLDLRSFEYPMEIGGSTLGIFACVLLILLAFPKLFWFVTAFLILAGGGLALWMKSWVEELHVSLWTCPEHAAELRLPGAVIDQNELHLFLPTDQLAYAARNELAALRRQLAGGRPGGGAPGGGYGGPVNDPLAKTVEYPARPTAPPISSLPPIKLAGDDEESQTGG